MSLLTVPTADGCATAHLDEAEVRTLGGVMILEVPVSVADADGGWVAGGLVYLEVGSMETLHHEMLWLSKNSGHQPAEVA